MNLNLTGKKALITGGSRGIGLAIKKALEAEGVEVISWSRTEGVDLNYVNKMPEFPKVDILINNFGGGGTSSDSVNVMAKNYQLPVILINDFLRTVGDWGRVITISSIHGKEAGYNPYFTAAKAAQIALMKTFARKYAGIEDITFNTICPGHIDVGKPFPDEPRIIGEPEDVAGIVVFLCSDMAKHINGSCIVVDGGESHSF